MAVGDTREPQARMLAFSAAGGGFGGALIAIIVAKILQGPCCCTNQAPGALAVGAASETQAVVQTQSGD